MRAVRRTTTRNQNGRTVLAKPYSSLSVSAPNSPADRLPLDDSVFAPGSGGTTRFLSMSHERPTRLTPGHTPASSRSPTMKTIKGATNGGPYSPAGGAIPEESSLAPPLPTMPGFMGTWPEARCLFFRINLPALFYVQVMASVAPCRLKRAICPHPYLTVALAIPKYLAHVTRLASFHVTNEAVSLPRRMANLFMKLGASMRMVTKLKFLMNWARDRLRRPIWVKMAMNPLVALPEPGEPSADAQTCSGSTSCGHRHHGAPTKPTAPTAIVASIRAYTYARRLNRP